MSNLSDKDKQYIWHPFTQMQLYPDAVPIVRAKNEFLYTEDDKEIIDAVASWWVNIHGHSNAYIAEKIYGQAQELEHVIFARFTHPKSVELAERLINKINFIQKAFYSDNGSTAVEIAVKMAIQYWFNKGKKRNKIIALENGYHGDTFGSMSVSDRSILNEPFFPFLFEVEFVPAPTPGNEDKCFAALKAKLKSDDYAGIIYEPLVQGFGGMLMYKPEAMEEMLQICKSKELLLIADEVMTGFYRTGKFLASDYCATKPDLIALSKGITGGALPLGLTCCTQEIYDAFLSSEMEKMFTHGHSYTANPIVCAAACASLDLLEKDECLQQIKSIEKSHKIFAEKIKGHKNLKDIRQTGTIIAIEFRNDEPSSYFNPLKDMLYNTALENGVLLRPLGNVLYIIPPYCICEKSLQKVYDTLMICLEKV